jgi:hypothetical protein
MNDVRGTGPVRPNLWAGRLTSYAFSVEAAIGQNPMRYLVARRFDENHPARALTVLFVVRPQVLFGTYVRIDEGAAGGDCAVHTFLPTMARPVRVAETHVFDCLPLTDVGYLDLMAWPHPALRVMRSDGTENLDAAPATTIQYQGPPSVPALLVCEEIDAELSVVTRRILYRDGRQVRRWEVTARGAAGQESLPLRIKVARPQTGHETEFVRDTPAVPVPPEVFDEAPARLRELIEQRLFRR